MRDEDIIGLIVGLVILVVVLAVYIGLIVLGVQIAKRKHRSPHWMWFAIHPMGLIVVLIVLGCLQPLKTCAQCHRPANADARLCGYCGYPFPQYPQY